MKTGHCRDMPPHEISCKPALWVACTFSEWVKVGFIIVRIYIRGSLTVQHKIECVFLINDIIQEPVIDSVNVTGTGR
jgi:hypothetical protein